MRCHSAVTSNELISSAPQNVMPRELFQSIVETMEIMDDAEMMEALRRGIRDVQEGNLVSLDEVKAELGIAD